MMTRYICGCPNCKIGSIDIPEMKLGDSSSGISACSNCCSRFQFYVNALTNTVSLVGEVAGDYETGKGRDKTCGNCGKSVEDDWSYCAWCGRSLSDW